jgi:putative phage-type endonuclease
VISRYRERGDALRFYLIEDIKKGTSQWHEWRRGVIGSSEASIIMGENRWTNRQQLMDEKLGLAKPFAGNQATQQGDLLAPKAIKALANHFNEKLKAAIVQDAEEPCLAASLDAINEAHDQIFEIKCGYKTYESVRQTGRVPSYYLAQLQHMMMVTQMESLVFSVYQPGKKLLISEVLRNDSYIEILRQEELEFADELHARGLRIQSDFRGFEVSSLIREQESDEIPNLTTKAQWVNENGLTKYWNGVSFVEGEGAGLYEIENSLQYWDGQEWFIPLEVRSFDLNGQVLFWNGKQWEVLQNEDKKNQSILARLLRIISG